MGRNKGGKGRSSSKKKEKEQDPAKEKQNKDFYENEWFKNPLNDPEVYSTTDFTRALAAYEAIEAIPKIIQALEGVQDILREWLLMNNQIDSDEEEEKEDEEEEEKKKKKKRKKEKENPFILIKKRKSL